MSQQSIKTVLVDEKPRKSLLSCRATTVILMISIITPLILITLVYQTQTSTKNEVLGLWSSALIAAIKRNRNGNRTLLTPPSSSLPPRRLEERQQQQDVTNDEYKTMIKQEDSKDDKNNGWPFINMATLKMAERQSPADRDNSEIKLIFAAHAPLDNAQYKEEKQPIEDELFDNDIAVSGRITGNPNYLINTAPPFI